MLRNFDRTETRLAAIGLLAALTLWTSACSSQPPAEPESEPASDYTACEDPRPEMCTREFLPVCAERDTGIRCVTTPCDSTEWVTLATACTACSDSKVLGHRPGACPENP
jgi:hypothetical protein